MVYGTGTGTGMDCTATGVGVATCHVLVPYNSIAVSAGNKVKKSAFGYMEWLFEIASVIVWDRKEISEFVLQYDGARTDLYIPYFCC